MTLIKLNTCQDVHSYTEVHVQGHQLLANYIRTAFGVITLSNGDTESFRGSITCISIWSLKDEASSKCTLSDALRPNFRLKKYKTLTSYWRKLPNISIRTRYNGVARVNWVMLYWDISHKSAFSHLHLSTSIDFTKWKQEQYIVRTTMSAVISFQVLNAWTMVQVYTHLKAAVVLGLRPMYLISDG